MLRSPLGGLQLNNSGVFQTPPLARTGQCKQNPVRVCVSENGRKLLKAVSNNAAAGTGLLLPLGSSILKFRSPWKGVRRWTASERHRELAASLRYSSLLFAVGHAQLLDMPNCSRKYLRG